jgi:hypothetical protein
MLPKLVGVLLILSACSGEKTTTPETTTPDTATPAADSSGGKLTEGDAKLWAGTCQALAALGPDMEDGLADPEKVKEEITKVAAIADQVTDEEVKKAISALSEFSSYEDSGFDEVYSAARQSCAIWGAKLGGIDPAKVPQNNAGSADNEANPVRTAHGKTCGVVFEAIRQYQDGSVTLEETEAKVKGIEEYIEGLENPDAEKALQALVDWVDTDEGSLPDLMSAAIAACSAVIGQTNGSGG